MANAALGAVLSVLQAERIADAVRGRVLSLQNACLQVAAPAGIGLAGVIAEFASPITAGLTLVGIWLAIATTLMASRALTDLEPLPTRR